ncbi:keratin-associated protein 26-1-like, partial [Orcinus orca]|uniref:keratin-associated protein 26-1-like n=1 Tax=Orcinus orca TaxID=9733 RepID=UPI0002BCD0B1
NLTVPGHNDCSGNYSLRFLRNACHVPSPSSIALCSTNVSGGDVLCLPSSCQDHTWLLNNGQETCSEPTSCQPASCEPSNCETSSCPSSSCYVPRPCQGTSFLPASSCISGSCFPVCYRPLSYVSSSCQPQRLLTYGCRLLGYLPGGPHTHSITHYSLYLLHVSNYSTFALVSYHLLVHPTLPLLWDNSFGIVSNSLRPLHPLFSGCQPLTHVFSTCHPSCSAWGGL